MRKTIFTLLALAAMTLSFIACSGVSPLAPIMGGNAGGGGLPQNVALFHDDPSGWGSETVSNASILDAHGIPYTIFSSADMGNVDLSPFDKVVTDSEQDTPFYDALAANKAWFETWIQAGGVMEMHLGHNASSSVHSLVFPGGASTEEQYSDYVSIAAPGHPVLAAPNEITDDMLDNWNYSTHAYIDQSGPGALTILVDDDPNPGAPVLQEWPFGAGHVIVSTQTIPAEWTVEDPGHSGGPLFLENMLLYMP